MGTKKSFCGQASSQSMAPWFRRAFMQVTYRLTCASVKPKTLRMPTDISEWKTTRINAVGQTTCSLKGCPTSVK